MKVVVDPVHEAWTEITKETLRKSWRKILPIPKATSPLIPQLAELYKLAVDDDDKDSEASPPTCRKAGETYGCCIWRGLRIKIASDLPTGNDSGEPSTTCITDNNITTCIDDFYILFKKLGLKIENKEIMKWLQSDTNDSGVQVFMVSQPVEIEPQNDEDDDGEEESPCPVFNSGAARMFELCLSWLEHQPEATVHNTTVLRELRILAANKRMDSIIQTIITKYFNKLVSLIEKKKQLINIQNILCVYCLNYNYMHEHVYNV